MELWSTSVPCSGLSAGSAPPPLTTRPRGAVRLLTKSTALGWVKEGVRVNSVHPGFVETPILGDTHPEKLASSPLPSSSSIADRRLPDTSVSRRTHDEGARWFSRKAGFVLTDTPGDPVRPRVAEAVLGGHEGDPRRLHAASSSVAVARGGMMRH